MPCVFNICEIIAYVSYYVSMDDLNGNDTEIDILKHLAFSPLKKISTNSAARVSTEHSLPVAQCRLLSWRTKANYVVLNEKAMTTAHCHPKEKVYRSSTSPNKYKLLITMTFVMLTVWQMFLDTKSIHLLQNTVSVGYTHLMSSHRTSREMPRPWAWNRTREVLRPAS